MSAAHSTRTYLVRPRLRVAALIRAPEELQLGVDPPEAVVVCGLAARSLAGVLRRADGSRTPGELADLGARAGLDRARLTELLARLQADGLLADPNAQRNRWALRRVRVVGTGPIGGAIADSLAQAGIGRLVLADEQTAPAGRHGASRAAELQSGLQRRHPETTLNLVNHWTKPESGCDLTVVAADTIEPDRGITEGLLRADQTTLLVRPTEHGVVVGPAVLPGRSACVGCLDLRRRDADPAWPHLLSQLVRTVPDLAATAVGWAAAVTTQQVLALLDGAAAETVGATMELRAADHLMTTRRWAAHPVCGCAWGSAAEWEP